MKKRSGERKTIQIFIVVLVVVMIYLYKQKNKSTDKRFFRESVFKTFRCKEEDYFQKHVDEFRNLDMENDKKVTPQYNLIRNEASLGTKYFVDIGVNRGDFTNVLLSFNPDAVVDCYDVIGKFVDNVKRRFTGKNVFGYHLAMTDGTGPGEIEIRGAGDWKSDKSYHTGASVLTRDKNHNVILETVKTSSLDNVYFETNVVIDFLKIDTEGFDARVLHGGEKMFRSRRIKFVFFEVNKMQLEIGDNLFDTTKFMQSLGYNCFLMGSKQSIYLNDLCRQSELFDSVVTLNAFCK